MQCRVSKFRANKDSNVNMASILIRFRRFSNLFACNLSYNLRDL